MYEKSLLCKQLSDKIIDIAGAQDICYEDLKITYDILRKLSVLRESEHYYSDHKLVENVRLGIMNMSKRPDYLLFLDKDDWTYDLDTICGIKVLHTPMDSTPFDSSYSDDIRFIPCFEKEKSDMSIYVKEFLDGCYN